MEKKKIFSVLQVPKRPSGGQSKILEAKILSSIDFPSHQAALHYSHPSDNRINTVLYLRRNFTKAGKSADIYEVLVKLGSREVVNPFEM